eukprot:gene10044-12301_t
MAEAKWMALAAAYAAADDAVPVPPADPVPAPPAADAPPPDPSDAAADAPLPDSEPEESSGRSGSKTSFGKYNLLGKVEADRKTATASAENLIGKDQLKAFKDQLVALRKKQAQGDAVIVTVLKLNKLTQYHLIRTLGIGHQRLKRVLAANPGLSTGPSNRKTEQEKEAARQYVNAVKSEQGLACTHKQQREYLLEGDFTDMHKAYVKDQQAAKLCFYGYDYFFNVISTVRSWLRRARLRQDECDACMRITMMLKFDSGMTPERREALIREKESHYNESKTQRAAYNTTMKKLRDSWNDPAPVAEPLLLDLADADHPRPVVKACTKARNGVQWSEDYAGSLTDPFWGTQRPNSDYWTSNKVIHAYVCADTTRGHNFVYCYDELSAGKGADAVATLRWLHITRY